MSFELTLLANQAIKAALDGDWERAIEINGNILASEPNNVETINRLARAYREMGKTGKAKELYQKVLKLDRLNVIAQRGLAKLKTKTRLGKNEEKLAVSGKGFLEEAGKTKLVQLLYPADGETLAALDSGDPVKLLVGKHRICIHDCRGQYLGRLPDDLAVRLIKLVTAGNKYEAIVKSVEDRQIRVFLREVERGGKVCQIASFPVGERMNYVAFTPPELVHKEKPDMRSFEDLEDKEGELGGNEELVEEEIQGEI